MTTTAEAALSALARDLADELAMAQAVELAGPEAVDELQLAIFNVRSHKRTERVGGKVVTEQVRDYSAHRLPGQGLEHPGQSMLGEVEHYIKGDPGHMGHNISQPDWVAHEWKGHQTAQKAWQKAEPRVKGKPKSTEQIRQDIHATRQHMGFPQHATQDPANNHLLDATTSLSFRGKSPDDIDRKETAEAYHSLSKAHDHIVENVIPHAKPEEYPQLAEHLQRISGHMQDLDKAMGANPESTRKLLGTYRENFAHAGEARRMRDLQALEAQAESVRPENSAKQMRDYYNFMRAQGYSDKKARAEVQRQAKESGLAVPDDLLPDQGPVKTGLEDQIAQAHLEALAAQFKPGQQVLWRQAGAPDVIGTVTGDKPDSPGYVPVSVPGGDYGVMSAHPAELTPVPEPPKGAAAVHPGLGGHLQRIPGETISQRAYSHVPQPFEVPPPNPDQGRALKAEAQAKQASEELAYQRGMQASLREERRNNAVLERMGLPAPGTYRPLSDEEYALHQKQVDDAVAQAFKQGLDTSQLYTENGDGYTWEPDRASLHHDMIKEFMDKQVDVPSQRHVILVGGLPGAGKSTIFAAKGITKNDYAIISADDFKEEMARRGMIPEVAGLSPMEASALVHEESKYLAAVAQHEMQRRGKNVALEITMSRQNTVERKIAAFEKNGYHVTGLLVDIPAETSADRAENRYHTALEAYRRGDNPLGGRYILRGDLLKAEASPGLTYPRSTFENLKGKFGSWERWDGTQSPARLAEQSGQEPVPGEGIPSAEALRRDAEQARRTQTSQFLQDLQQPLPQEETPAAPEAPSYPWDQSGSTLSFHGSLGIPREQMPQISGVGKDGLHHGPAETVPQFFDQLQSRGITATIERAPVSSLRPSQTDGSVNVTRSIAGDLASGQLADTKPVLVSSDSRVIDGHHTWAAHALNSAEGRRTGVAPGVPVIRASAPADRMLQELRDFADRNGFANMKVGQNANPAGYGTPAAMALDTESAAKAAEKGTAAP